jgi:hypothetical protein
MRPYSAQPLGRRLEGSQHRRASTPPAPTPRSGKSGKDLEQLIQRLDSEFQLGLKIRDETWSPAKSDRSLPDQVHGSIKALYWSAYPVLTRVVDEFKHQVDVAPTSPSKAKLTLLHKLLRKETPSPGFRRQPRTNSVPSVPSISSSSHGEARTKLRSSLCKYAHLLPLKPHPCLSFTRSRLRSLLVAVYVVPTLKLLFSLCVVLTRPQSESIDSSVPARSRDGFGLCICITDPPRNTNGQ